MNTPALAPLPTAPAARGGAPDHLLELPPVAQAAHPVRALDCEPDGWTELRVLRGRVWLTREGWPQDVFLDAGQHWRVEGAARLHLSAEGESGAQLGVRLRRW